MDRFSECALFALVCDAAFAIVAAAIALLVFSFDLRLALTICAGIALLVSLRAIHRWSQVRKHGIVHTELWQMMPPEELPDEAQSIRHAQDRMEELLLRFAKGASGATILFCSASIMAALN